MSEITVSTIVNSESDFISTLEKETSLVVLGLVPTTRPYFVLHLEPPCVSWDSISEVPHLDLVTNEQFLEKAKKLVPYSQIGAEYEWIATDADGKTWVFYDQPKYNDKIGEWQSDNISENGPVNINTSPGKRSLIKIKRDD